MTVNKYFSHLSVDLRLHKTDFFNDTEGSLLYHFIAAYGLFNFFNGSAIVHFLSRSVL